MVIYLSGPMRGFDQCNLPLFHKVGALLKSQGYVVYNPAEHDNELGHFPVSDSEGRGDCIEQFKSIGLTLNESIRWDLDVITRSEGIVLLPGWEKSSGALLEKHLADFLSLEIGFYDPETEKVTWA